MYGVKRTLYKLWLICSPWVRQNNGAAGVKQGRVYCCRKENSPMSEAVSQGERSVERVCIITRPTGLKTSPRLTYVNSGFFEHLLILGPGFAVRRAVREAGTGEAVAASAESTDTLSTRQFSLEQPHIRLLQEAKDAGVACSFLSEAVERVPPGVNPSRRGERIVGVVVHDCTPSVARL